MLQNERMYLFEPISEIEDFRDFIQQFNIRFHTFASWKQNQLSGYNPITDVLAAELYKTLTAPAKRLRPLFLYCTHRMLNNNLKQTAVIQLATALELFHDFALIHDDITDLASTRRGKPTIETFFKGYAVSKNQASYADHIGLNMAMYGGDIMLFQATFLANTLSLDQPVLHAVQDIFYEMQTEVVAGQNDDGMGVAHDEFEDISEERIRSILSLKSGRYSIQKPMMLAGALNEVDKDTMKHLTTIGEDFGIIFQLKDDLLGVFGEEHTTGKSTSSDIVEGKRTLLMHQTYFLATANDRSRLKSILGNRDATQEDIEFVKQLVITTGVKKSMEQLCKDGVNKFIEGLDAIRDCNEKYTKILKELALYIVERKL